MKVSPLARCLIALPVLILLLAMLAKEAMLGWADYNGREARYWLDQAILGKKPMDEATWDRTRMLLESSLEWDPDNATFTEDLANLHFLRAAASRSGAQAKAHYEAALRHYFRASKLRPTSAYTHASIATVKLQLGQFDPDFATALLLASRYGPWEPKVEDQVMVAGLRAWGALGEPARNAVRGSVRRAYQLDPRHTVALVSALKSSAPDCSQLRLSIQEICPSK